MSKIHLHIEELSLPGYTPTERRKFIADLEKILARQASTRLPDISKQESREVIRTRSPSLEPQAVARQVITALSIGGKENGGRK